MRSVSIEREAAYVKMIRQRVAANPPGTPRAARDHTERMRRPLAGSLAGFAAVAALSVSMLPLRSHLAVSTAALILVIPVVVGAVVGGFVAGLVSVTAGFLAFDFLYIPPYNTLNVGTAQNWTALGVYAVVMLLVARVVARLDSRARRPSAAARWPGGSRTSPSSWSGTAPWTTCSTPSCRRSTPSSPSPGCRCSSSTRGAYGSRPRLASP